MSTVMVLTALLFSLSSCIDNVVVGIAYGIKKIKIGLWSNLMIAGVTTTGTFLSMSLGWYVTTFIPPKYANYIGSGVMILLGLYFVLQSVTKLTLQTQSKSVALKDLLDMMQYASDSDLDQSGDINLKEAFLVSLGLTFNNIGAGIAASITGVSISVTVIATFVISLLAIVLGETLGSHVFGKFLGKFAPLIAGGLLLVLGVVEMLL